MIMAVHALIVAAGRASRFGGQTPKQYVPLLGKPVLSHSIDAMEKTPGLRGITLALAADDPYFCELVQPRHGKVKTVTGGATRAESVIRGLDAIRESDPEANWVMVHDAARPCIDPGLVLDLLEAVSDHEDGAILAMPVGDSLKRADESGLIRADVDRDDVWAAQTPQLFPVDRLAVALRHMMNSERQPTDDASAMQMTGAKPRLVMGSTHNIKITWPEDIVLAEAILNARNNRKAGK